MTWCRDIAGPVGLIAMCLGVVAGCSVGDDSGAQATGATVEGMFIQPVEMGLGQDAPEWCVPVLDPSVRSLPSLAEVATDADAAVEIEVVVQAAAAVLESRFAEAPESVDAAARELAVALQSLDATSPSPESLYGLDQAMTAFGEEVDACGLS